MPKLKVVNPGVPVGSYLARFADVEDIETQYGEGLRWAFEVTKGKFKGKETSRITSQDPTLRNACGKMLAAIIGSSLSDGQEVELDDFVDAEYHVNVEETDGGGTRVGSVISVNNEGE